MVDWKQTVSQQASKEVITLYRNEQLLQQLGLLRNHRKSTCMYKIICCCIKKTCEGEGLELLVIPHFADQKQMLLEKMRVTPEALPDTTTLSKSRSIALSKLVAKSQKCETDWGTELRLHLVIMLTTTL